MLFFSTLTYICQQKFINIINMDLINIFEVSNISSTLKYLKSKNFWVCGFDKNGTTNFTKHDW